MMFLAPRLRRDIVCQQAVELITGYLEGTLACASSRRFQAHLAGCPQCTEYLAQMCKTIELTRSLTMSRAGKPPPLRTVSCTRRR
jgi:anti-sigma factor RsiW